MRPVGCRGHRARGLRGPKSTREIHPSSITMTPSFSVGDAQIDPIRGLRSARRSSAPMVSLALPRTDRVVHAMSITPSPKRAVQHGHFHRHEREFSALTVDSRRAPLSARARDSDERHA